jgi:hypothetical protein
MSKQCGFSNGLFLVVTVCAGATGSLLQLMLGVRSGFFGKRRNFPALEAFIPPIKCAKSHTVPC